MHCKMSNFWEFVYLREAGVWFDHTLLFSTHQQHTNLYWSQPKQDNHTSVSRHRMISTSLTCKLSIQAGGQLLGRDIYNYRKISMLSIIFPNVIELMCLINSNWTVWKWNIKCCHYHFIEIGTFHCRVLLAWNRGQCVWRPSLWNQICILSAEHNVAVKFTGVRSNMYMVDISFLITSLNDCVSLECH